MASLRLCSLDAMPMHSNVDTTLCCPVPCSNAQLDATVKVPLVVSEVHEANQRVDQLTLARVNEHHWRALQATSDIVEVVVAGFKVLQRFERKNTTPLTLEHIGKAESWPHKRRSTLFQHGHQQWVRQERPVITRGKSTRMTKPLLRLSFEDRSASCKRDVVKVGTPPIRATRRQEENTLPTPTH